MMMMMNRRYTLQMNSSVNVNRHEVLYTWIILPTVTHQLALKHYITAFSRCQKRHNRSRTCAFIQKFKWYDLFLRLVLRGKWSICLRVLSLCTRAHTCSIEGLGRRVPATTP